MWRGGALLLNDANAIDNAEVIRKKEQTALNSYVDLLTNTAGCPLALHFCWGVIRCLPPSSTQIRNEDYCYKTCVMGSLLNVLQDLASADYISLPHVPQHCEHNAHMFYVLLNERYNRAAVLTKLNSAGIGAVSHYEPLHLSLAGQQW